MELKLVETTLKIKTDIALDNVSLEIPDKGITGILGDYGSGKSSVLSIFAGYRSPDSGVFLSNGKKVHFNSVRDAIKQGIGSIDPNLNSYDKFTLRQNLYLDPKFNPKKLLDIEQVFTQFCDHLEIKFDFNDLFGIFPDQYKLMFEIIRHHIFGIRLILIDEPFRYFKPDERALLKKLFDLLRDNGTQIVFSTQNLNDIYQVCDNCVILEKGKVITQVNKPFEQLEKFISYLNSDFAEQPPKFSDQILLQIKNYQTSPLQNSINFDLHSGEIVGIIADELKDAENFLLSCVGLQKAVSGEFILNGFDLFGKPLQEFINDGVALIPKNRLSSGLIADMMVYEHFGLVGDQSTFTFNFNEIKKDIQKSLLDFDIHTSEYELTKNLSTRDQAKLLFAILPRRLSLLVCLYPTDGLDLETKNWVWNQINRRAMSGIGVVVLCSDINEYKSRVHTVWQHKGGIWQVPLESNAFFMSTDENSAIINEELNDEFA